MKKIILLLLLYIPALNLVNAQDYSFNSDKQLHFAAGGILGTVGYVTTYDLTEGNRFASYLGGTASAGIVGLLKEFYDSRSNGTGFNEADLVYTALGGLVSSFVTDLIMSKQTYKQRKRRRIIKQ